MFLSLFLTMTLFLLFCFGPILLFEKQSKIFKKNFLICRIYFFLFTIPFFSSFFFFFEYGFDAHSVLTFGIFSNSIFFPAALLLIFVPALFDFYLYIDEKKRMKKTSLKEAVEPFSEQ